MLLLSGPSISSTTALLALHLTKDELKAEVDVLVEEGLLTIAEQEPAWVLKLLLHLQMYAETSDQVVQSFLKVDGDTVTVLVAKYCSVSSSVVNRLEGWVLQILPDKS